MVKIRAQLEKGPEARFISHLDLMRSIERALRRTGLPVAYSEGFNPHPKIAFASAMPLGATSVAEFLDVIFSDRVLPGQLMTALNEQLPRGLRIIEAREVQLSGPALMAAIDAATWQVTFPVPAAGREAVVSAVERLLGAGVYPIVHSGKHGDSTVDLLSLIDRLEAPPTGDGHVRLLIGLTMGQRGAVRPEEVVAALADLGKFAVERGDIELKRLAMAAGKGAISPWDI